VGLITRRAGSVVRERKDGSRALFNPPPVHEGGAVDQDLVDLGAAGTELAAVLQLEREDLLWADGDRAHAVVFVGVGQAVDPGVHVAAIEVREPERLRERVVERTQSWICDIGTSTTSTLSTLSSPVPAVIIELIRKAGSGP
jgi:hypothetical protein